MTFNARMAALLTAGALGLAATVVPAGAASVTTEAFLANVRPNIDFLQRSSRLAPDHSSSKRIRAFAASEGPEQDAARNVLGDWVQVNTARGTLSASFLDVATAPVAAAPDLVTGRSVALDIPVVINTAPEARRELLPAGQTDLDRLAERRGSAFDRLFRGTQLDALRQLSTLYASYIQNGDDPTLRAIAVQELPKINSRIAQVRRL